VLVAGLFLFAVAIVLQLESRLGLSPWDTLHQGISRHTRLSFGMASVCVSVVVLLLAWRLGARVGVGTVANAVLVGTFIEALTAIGPVDRLSESPLGVRIVLLAVSMVLVGIGSALYLGAWLGAGPRDSLMVVGGERTGLRLGARPRRAGSPRARGRVRARRHDRSRHRRLRPGRRAGARGGLLGAPALGARACGRRCRQPVAGTARRLARSAGLR
jgi:hypothetical protein